MPELGVNAIYKAGRALSKLEGFDFNAKPHPVMGKPTLNVGTFAGGSGWTLQRVVVATAMATRAVARRDLFAFAEEFAISGVPVVAVLGNHDHHSGLDREIAAPPAGKPAHPCDACDDRPCLTACPVGALAVPGHARHPPRGRPPPVAVHDHGDVQGARGAVDRQSAFHRKVDR